MKKCLFVLLLLAIAAPAGADVLVYKMSNKCVLYDEGSPDWEIEKESTKGYVVLEGGPGDDTVDLWSIDLWKDRDPNTGKMQKYAGSFHVGQFEIIEAEIGGKTYWIIAGGDEQEQLFLSGIMTKARLGDSDEAHFAKKLTGTFISDEELEGEREIESIKVTLTLQKKQSAEMQSLDAKDAVKEILDGLKGYKIVPTG